MCDRCVIPAQTRDHRKKACYGWQKYPCKSSYTRRCARRTSVDGFGCAGTAEILIRAAASQGLQGLSFLITQCRGRYLCLVYGGKYSCSDGHRCVDRSTFFSSSPVSC